MKQVVLASRNSKKLAEMQALLSPMGWQLRLISDFTAEAAEETAPTFVENALLKARHASRISGLPAIADDSGLEVEALDGQPGVLSARFAGVAAADTANNDKLLRLLDNVVDEHRQARFVCVMTFLRSINDPVPLIAQGLWGGRILHAPRGANGFGYDPLFFVPAHGCSSAELEPAVKNGISHRAQAAARLLALLRG
jgi:XTP/dITP diphosphohydrolase